MDSTLPIRPTNKTSKPAKPCHFFQVGKCTKSDCRFLHVLNTTNTNDQIPNRSFVQSTHAHPRQRQSTPTAISAQPHLHTSATPESQKEITIDDLVVSLRHSGFEIDRIISLEPKLIMNNLTPSKIATVIQTLQARPSTCVSSVKCNKHSVTINLPNETADPARVCKIINSMFSFTDTNLTKRATIKSQFGDTIVWKGSPASGIIGILGEISTEGVKSDGSAASKFTLPPDKIATLLLSGSKHVFIDDIFSLKIYQTDLIALGNITLSKYLKSVRSDVVVQIAFSKKYCNENKVHVVLCDVRQFGNNDHASNKLIYTQVTIVGGTDAARLQVRKELQSLMKPTVVKLSYAEILQIKASQGMISSTRMNKKH